MMICLQVRYFIFVAILSITIENARSADNQNSVSPQIVNSLGVKQPQRAFNKPQGAKLATPQIPGKGKLQTDPECTADELNNTRQNLTKSTDPSLHFPLVEEGMFWSKDVENILPEGLTDDGFREWRRNIERRELVHIERGTLTKCGRDGNAHAILGDGTQLCIRNSKHGSLGLLGEMLAFQLSRFMQIRTLPAIAIRKIATNENSTWAGQRSRLDEVALLDGTYVALIQWIPNLTEAHFPSMIQKEPSMVVAGNPILRTLDSHSMVYLAQWTDLLVFDYITGHIDRMTIVLDAVRRTGEKWLMRTSIHNLGRSSVTGGVCIFDNECAFFASYPLFHNHKMGHDLTKMYDDLLASVCVFRRSTVEAVTKLKEMDDVSGFLFGKLRESDIVAKEMVTEVFTDQIVIHKEINNRIEKVYNHMQSCLGTTDTGE